ncbi:FMN-binding negative transcriptional regulator [Vitreoscilla stercoraria]|uniref:FMN-binding negative transcriptional regulator n=1 Tax=Vitreoscilla stercoraria TaxID=61 RepID=A0ABY4ECL9_VITST|nr:FMN-binding negative transcriptional regulator [Vitreoscilla stercoraria]UOO93134.1 FMN-binding negative transcriptional regulator [Vitreoscilla stercoraria]
MYIPTEFQEVRPETIQALIQNYPLACLVAQTATGLSAIHLPLLMKSDTVLLGHLAVASDWHLAVPEGQEILCVFQGENAYISANDYPSKLRDHRKVPTWNYQVVHIHGTVSYLTDQKSKLAAVGMLTKKQERVANGEAAWKMSDAPKDYLLEQLAYLAVLEINIHKIEAQSKLSQNREAQDFDAVIEKLYGRGKHVLADNMSDLKSI